MKKQTHSLPARILSMLLALVCILGLLPGAALAASPDTIMEDCTHNGVHYESPALDTCWLHQMKFDYNGDTVTGFCADHGAAWAGPWKDMSGISHSPSATRPSRP